MDYQHALVELKNDELSVPLDGMHQLIANALAQQRELLAYYMVRRELRVDDAAAGELGRERSDDGFDFG